MFGAGAALMASTAWSSAATESEALPFTFDMLSDEMRDMAKRPFVERQSVLPEFISNLDYDQYRMIASKTDRALGAGAFRFHPFHLGWLFNQPVDIFELSAGMARPVVFTVDDFNYWNPDMATQAAHAALPGIAGFRLNYPLNQPGIFDELVSFLGASYFRALGKGSIYGLSARGLVVNSWLDRPEEFPRFSRFYIDPGEDGSTVTVIAALESDSVTGAYRFVITPGIDTIMEVTARLFFRKDVAELGVAPLTSMFLYAENNRADFDDYRPQVHDSDGLFIELATGERFWRTLNNPKALANSYLTHTNLRSFGLHQRNRDFDEYKDTEALYERRPSLNVEQIGDWGPGMVRLVEIPSTSEANDNVVAFWIPAGPVKAGEAREYAYKLRWGDLTSMAPDVLGRVRGTSTGKGGFAGTDEVTTSRKFVVEFQGGLLDKLEAGSQPDAFVSVSGGTVSSQTLERVDQQDVWRLIIDVEPAGDQVVELRAYMIGAHRKLTETWLYQWTPPV
jgi:glucans biosynthesis protein